MNCNKMRAIGKTCETIQNQVNKLEVLSLRGVIDAKQMKESKKEIIQALNLKEEDYDEWVKVMRSGIP